MKKPETRAKHDKVRAEHIEKIKELYCKATEYQSDMTVWWAIMNEIQLYELQLKIYDKEMGYGR